MNFFTLRSLILCATIGGAGVSASIIKVNGGTSNEGFRNQTPMYGRGYSVSTEALMSTCLSSPELSNPTFDYDYMFYEFNEEDNEQTSEYKPNDPGRRTYGWSIFGRISSRVRSETSTSSSSSTRYQYLSSMMRTDMYYNSIDDKTASLTPAAVNLLQRSEYIGFIQACGPNYVRTIRRTKQIAAMFQYRSSSTSFLSETTTDNVRSFSIGLRWWGFSYRGSSSSASTTSNKIRRSSQGDSLLITIFAEGLNFADMDDNDGTLVPKTMEDFDAVMAYGFEAMKNQHSGVIVSIEVIPWIANTGFHVAAQITTALEQERCQQLTARTCAGLQCQANGAAVSCVDTCFFEGTTDPMDCTYGFCTDATCYQQNTATLINTFAYVPITNLPCITNTVRNTFAVNEESFATTNEMYTEVTSEECDSVANAEYIRDNIIFSPQLMMFNYMSNAELIAEVDAIVRQMFNRLGLLTQCAGFLNSLSDEFLAEHWVENNLDKVHWADYKYYMNTNLRYGRPLDELDFTRPLGAMRLKSLLVGDACPNDTDDGCNLCARTATTSTGGCILRKRRFLYGRIVDDTMKYVKNFYSECLEQLSASDLQFDGGQLFTKHWSSITECAKPICLIRRSTWDGVDDCTLHDSFQNQNYIPASFADAEHFVQSYCMPEFRPLIRYR